MAEQSDDSYPAGGAVRRPDFVRHVAVSDALISLPQGYR